MKLKLILLLVLSYISFNLFSIEKTSIIEGFINNHSMSSISINDSIISVSETGKFVSKLVLLNAQMIPIEYNGESINIFIKPLEHIEVNFDEQDLDKTIKFKGKSSNINRILHQLKQIDRQLENYFTLNSYEWENLFSLSENKFMNSLDSLRLAYQQPLNELNDIKSFDETLLYNLQKKYEFRIYWIITLYSHFHERYTNTVVNLSDSTKSVLEKIDLDNPKFLLIDEYSELGCALLRLKILEEIESNQNLVKSDNLWLQASFNVVEHNFENQELKDYWFYHYLTQHIDNNGVKNLKAFADVFNNKCKSEALKSEFNALYQSELNKRTNHLIKTYKTIDGFELDAHIFIPQTLKENQKMPAIVNFHGGSWSEGKPDWKFGYSKLGFINICIEYRTYDRYGKLPFEQISDAKSAIRYLRKNAEEFHIDKDKIIATGNSSGGHLALCTAMLEILDEPSEDKSISSKPNAIILTSAVFNIDKKNWFSDIVNDSQKLKSISPLQNIKPNLPPMLIFHGTADNFSSPYNNCVSFIEKMKQNGNDITFYPIKNANHWLWRNGAYWQMYGKASNDFYSKLGFLSE